MNDLWSNRTPEAPRMQPRSRRVEKRRRDFPRFKSRTLAKHLHSPMGRARRIISDLLIYFVFHEIEGGNLNEDVSEGKFD